MKNFQVAERVLVTTLVAANAYACTGCEHGSMEENDVPSISLVSRDISFYATNEIRLLDLASHMLMQCRFGISARRTVLFEE